MTVGDGSAGRSEIVVADTTPLLYLARIGRLNLLGEMFGRVILPGVVWRELVDGRPDAAGVEAVRAAAWIEVDRSADSSPLASEFAREVDPGEATAIALALTRHASLLLIDDLDGRRLARSRGLAIRGTVGVLLAARQAGRIAGLQPDLLRLRAEGFRVDEAVVRAALQAAGEWSEGAAGSPPTGKDD